MTFSNELLHMDVPVFTDHQKFTYIRSVRTLDAGGPLRSLWTIGMDSEKESRNPVLSEHLDDDDDEEEDNKFIQPRKYQVTKAGNLFKFQAAFTIIRWKNEKVANQVKLYSRVKLRI